MPQSKQNSDQEIAHHQLVNSPPHPHSVTASTFACFSTLYEWIIKYVIWGAWILSLNSMLVGFIPIVACDCRFLLMCSILLCEYTTIIHSTMEHLGCFSLRKLEATVNAVAMIISVYNFCWTHVTFLLDIKRSGILDNQVCKWLVYMDAIKECPTVIDY